MLAANIICFIIYGFVALIMIGIGLSQKKSKVPVAFYSGETPLTEKELSDVPMWNKKHGTMWIVYGLIILLSYAVGAVMDINSVWSMIPLVGGVTAPIFVMIWYHHRLIRIYKR